MKRILLFSLLLLAYIGLMPILSVSAAGSTIAVELPANQTTGYIWTYKMSEDNILTEESSTYLPARGNDETVGRGGKQVWIFRAVSPGSAAITFTYQRPWEAGATASDNVTYFYAVDTSLAITMIGRSSSSVQSIRPVEDPADML